MRGAAQLALVLLLWGAVACMVGLAAQGAAELAAHWSRYRHHRFLHPHDGPRGRVWRHTR
jgi:hypothetical protein